MTKKEINIELAVNTLRVLSATAITNANSGHPGIALGAAPIFYDLFVEQMNISPTDHDFYNRDRFVLSAGHASSLLYATMLLCGYDNITMDDLKNFRQIGSKTAGHPEPELLHNIEVSSGPLGQGIAMAVGLAIAQKKMANLCNTPNIKLLTNKVYCLFGDGCFEEGISYESIAIAGRLRLDNLIMIYDYNEIQLDGKVSDSTVIDTTKYFKAMDWDVLDCDDNVKNIHKAINEAKLANKPTVILCHTTLGYGSCNANSNKAHGTPLNPDQLEQLRKNLNFEFAPFLIPSQLDCIKQYVKERTDKEISEFEQKLNLLGQSNKELCDNVIKNYIDNQFNFDINWFDVSKFPQKEATRNISGQVLNIIAQHNKNIICANADLSGSTKIGIKDSPKITEKNWDGKNLDCGVREFAMAAINNGIIAFGGMKAIGSTFMSFSDYNKAAIRLAAISKIPAINVYSHDSITVGEDGPTHQPIEQLWTLRMIPNHITFRPSSYMDTIVAFEYAFNSKKTPCSIVTSRSAFNQVNVDHATALKGAYVVYQPNGSHELTIYASGSEVELAIEVAKAMKRPTRVVAVNSLEIFEKQDEKYKRVIFDKNKKVSIEFGVTAPWYKYVDLAIGIDQYGMSGKPADVIKKLGLTTSEIVEKINKTL